LGFFIADQGLSQGAHLENGSAVVWGPMHLFDPKMKFDQKQGGTNILGAPNFSMNSGAIISPFFSLVGLFF